MTGRNRKLDKILVVRITSDQYMKLLEAIVNENKKVSKSKFQALDKSKIIREFIEKYENKAPTVS